MAVTASRPIGQPAQPSPATRPSARTERRRPAAVPISVLAPAPAISSGSRALRPVIPTADALSFVEHVLPLSGCRLSVLDLPDGSRVGQLYGPTGRFLDEARCQRTGAVSGWFGRADPAAGAGGIARGTSWALAFGAGGAQESLEVRFASLRARRMVQVVSDTYGLWVAEVVGSFRAATLMSRTSAHTFRLHHAG